MFNEPSSKMFKDALEKLKNESKEDREIRRRRLGFLSDTEVENIIDIFNNRIKTSKLDLQFEVKQYNLCFVTVEFSTGKSNFRLFIEDSESSLELGEFTLNQGVFSDVVKGLCVENEVFDTYDQMYPPQNVYIKEFKGEDLESSIDLALDYILNLLNNFDI